MKYSRDSGEKPFKICPEEQVLHFACCDCGLVHEWVYEIKGDKQIVMTARRLNRATAQLRRHKFGYLQRPVKSDKYELRKRRVRRRG